MARAPLRPRDLERLRPVFTDRMPDTAQYTATVRTDNNRGGQTEVPTPITTKCLLRPAPQRSGQDDTNAGRLIESQIWDIALPYGTPAPTTEQIIVNGTTFRIISNDSPQSYGVMLHLLAVQGD